MLSNKDAVNTEICKHLNFELRTLKKKVKHLGKLDLIMFIDLGLHKVLLFHQETVCLSYYLLSSFNSRFFMRTVPFNASLPCC